MFFLDKKNSISIQSCPSCGATTIVNAKKKQNNPFKLLCSSCNHDYGYCCPLCPLNFDKPGKLTKHFALAHEIALKITLDNESKKKKCVCVICKQKIPFEDSLLHHQRELLQNLSFLSQKMTEKEYSARQRQELEQRPCKKARMNEKSEKIVNETINEKENSQEITFFPPADDEDDISEESDSKSEKSQILMQDQSLEDHIQQITVNEEDLDPNDQEENQKTTSDFLEISKITSEDEKQESSDQLSPDCGDETPEIEQEPENSQKDEDKSEKLPFLHTTNFDNDNPTSYFENLRKEMCQIRKYVIFPANPTQDMKKLQEIVKKAGKFSPNFNLQMPKLKILFQHLGNLSEIERETFKLYFSLSHKKAQDAANVIQLYLDKHKDILKHDYNWYIKLKKLLQDPIEKTIDGDCFPHFLRRIQKILSKYETLLQLTPTSDDYNFTSSVCYQRMFNYAQSFGKDVFPLVFLFWRDDLKLFDFSQVNSASFGGSFFKIMNFPAKFQNSLSSVFIFSLTKPHNQQIYYTIADLMNEISDGILYDKRIKLLPVWAIKLGDNPEKYSFMSSKWFNSDQPCNSCNIFKDNLPFSNNFIRTDRIYVQGLSAMMKEYVRFCCFYDVITQSTTLTQMDVDNYQTRHYLLLRNNKQIGSKTGHTFIKVTQYPQKIKEKLLQFTARKKLQTEKLDFIIPPFLMSISYWKGLFPLYFSVPHDPFHTIMNVVRSHLKFMMQKSLFDFNNCVIDLNSAIFKEKEARKQDLSFKRHALSFSSDFKMWHGDHFLYFLKRPQDLNILLTRTEQSHKTSTLKLFCLLAIFKNAKPSELLKEKIYNKFFLWKNQTTCEYRGYIQRKITFHHLEHLLQQVHYLGQTNNFTGIMCERKNKLVGENIQRVFGGGSISHQVVSAEVCNENMKMCFNETQLHEQEFDITSWLKLVVEW